MEYDMNSDGELSEQEVEFIEQERIDRRQDNQRKMAWIALGSMLLFTGLIFLPIIPPERIDAFRGIADLFYLAQAGVVSAYMGSEAIVNRSRKPTSNKPRGRLA
jgi:hypothetical protein